MIWTAILQQWKLIAIAVMAGALWIQGAMLDAAKEDLEQQRVVVEALAAAQAERAKVINEAQQENLKTIEARHDEKHVQEVRRRAVAAVSGRVQHTQPGSGAMPGIAAGQPADDGTREECAAAFAVVADAAEDADTLSMWQEWARLNNIPVHP